MRTRRAVWVSVQLATMTIPYSDRRTLPTLNGRQRSALPLPASTSTLREAFRTLGSALHTETAYVRSKWQPFECRPGAQCASRHSQGDAAQW